MKIKSLLFVLLLALCELAGPSYGQSLNQVQQFATQSAAASNVNGAIADVTGYSVVGLDVTISGTATVTFQVSANTNFANRACYPAGGGAFVTAATASGSFTCIVAGYRNFQTPITNCSGCTVTVNAFLTTAPVGQSDGLPTSTGQGVVDANTQRVFLAQKATYAAATTAKTATAAGTGPFFAICGSATKTIRIQQVIISGTVATAAVYGDVELTKTSTATSSGTPTALTKVPHDSNDAAASASLVNYYTALATAGAAVGKIASESAVFPITGTVAASNGYVIFDYTNRQESEAPVLRGTAQCVEASFGTTTTNAPTLTVQLFWTEE